MKNLQIVCGDESRRKKLIKLLTNLRLETNKQNYEIIVDALATIKRDMEGNK